jgi:hypothetical protein
MLLAALRAEIEESEVEVWYHLTLDRNLSHDPSYENMFLIEMQNTLLFIYFKCK